MDLLNVDSMLREYGFAKKPIHEELNPNGKLSGRTDDNDKTPTDYTKDNNDPSNDPTATPDDYTIPDDGEGQDNNDPGSNNNQSGNDDGTTDYTSDSESPENDTSGGDGNMNTGDVEDPSGGGDGGAPNGEEGDNEDENNMQEDNEGDMDDGGSDDEDDVKRLEDELFSRFNDQQIAIMTSELKSSYHKIYDSIDETIERINDMPKNEKYYNIIFYISEKLAEIRDVMTDYITKTFPTKSYVENKINYKRFIMSLNQINELLSQIYPKEGK